MWQRASLGDSVPRPLLSLRAPRALQSDTYRCYVDLGTGEVCGVFLERFSSDAGGLRELYEENVAEYEACESLMLPKPEDLGDYEVMREFASLQEGAAGEKLTRAVNGRGAFKRFRNAVSSLGLDGEWHAFRDEARRELARNFLEDNGLRWK